MVNQFSIDHLTKEPNQVEVLIQKCIYLTKKENKPIIFFGAGVIGLFYLNYFKKNKTFDQLYFCDNSEEKWGSFIGGIPVISFEELKSKYHNSYLIITSLSFYEEMLMQLKEHNLDSNLVDPLAHKILVSDIGCYTQFNNYYEIVIKNITKFEEVFNTLSDDLSKQIFIDRINYCISVNSKYLIPLKSNSPQYFEPDLINLSNNEVFIDGGAYIGDTVEEFIIQTNGDFDGVYSFEPENTKHDEFLNKFSEFKNIELLPYGLWNKEGILRFNAQEDYASGLSELGNMDIEVTSIDNVLKEGTGVTFIKMDIEGAELKALHGAATTIKKYKPKLAICVYHKPLDIVEIPLFIKKLVPGYKIYLRHYSDQVYETVCYAIPE
jgi:FkbM family methyltransferase